jgi:hypothetical protein
VVGLAIAKELAPVMMAILIAGRIGSAMAAEIGSMRVYQEIDALRTMNINPIHYLVLPRVVAIAVALPMLVVFAVLVGWFGGAVVAEATIILMAFRSRFFLRPARHRGPSRTWPTACSRASASPHHRRGLLPSGADTIGGPRGIGRSVTKAVVNSIVLIVIFDYLLTRFLLKNDPANHPTIPASASWCAACARVLTARKCSRALISRSSPAKFSSSWGRAAAARAFCSSTSSAWKTPDAGEILINGEPINAGNRRQIPHGAGLPVRRAAQLAHRRRKRRAVSDRTPPQAAGGNSRASSPKNWRTSA